MKPPHDDEALARDFLTIWFAQVYGQVRDIKKRTGAGDAGFEADTLAMAEIGRANGAAPLLRRSPTSRPTSTPSLASTRPTTTS